MLLDDGRILKASFKDCTVEDRQRFGQSSCLIPISVGQSVCEGYKFQATMDLVNKSFKSCTILVDDIIQRHTLKILSPTYNDVYAYNLADSMGTKWLEKHKHVYQNLSIPYEVIRWNRWLLHPEFNNRLNLVSNLYDTNHDYKASIDLSINEYLNRNIRKQDVNYLHGFTQCLTYLKEECAVMTLWVEEKYDFELYPKGRNQAMLATYKYLIQPENPDLLVSVALRFKKYNAAQNYIGR